MSSPASNFEGPRNVGRVKGRNQKGEKREEDRSIWMKLKLFLSCIAMGSRSRGFQNEKNNQSDDEVVRSVAGVSSSNNSRTSRSPTPEINRYPNLKQFTFHELRLATGSFAAENVLGEGGFGLVYKGWISHNGSSPSKPGMGIPVAVKTLNVKGNQGHREWEAEINHLGALRHPNLVKLVGYCIEDEQRVLVYEFTPRGSLENHLFKGLAMRLTWTIRMKIMLGAAKGVAFLHEEAQNPLIYRDFKTSNILLDSDYNAKLSDFGLAKDAPVGDITHVTTRVMGTPGYAAPEYVRTGRLTSKSDVYSFGVVLLEMLTGRKATDRRRPYKEQHLVQWAAPFLTDERRFHHLMDPRLEGRYSRKGAYKAMRLVTHCIQSDQKSRPLMSEVVQMMRSILDCNDIPGSPSPPSPIQSFHVGTSSSSGANKYGPQGASPSASSSRSTPTRFQASPLSRTPLRSPKPNSRSP